MLDNKNEEKIRKLLDKAYSTNFAEEAETYLAKATELMAKFGISEAALRANSPMAETVIVCEVMKISGKFLTERRRLSAWILDALGVRVILTSPRIATKGEMEFTVFATASTLEVAKQILSMAEMHCLKEMGKAEVVGSAISFRKSFLIGYGDKLSRILEDSFKDAQEESLKNESASTALVLVSEKEKIENAVNEKFPHLTTIRSNAPVNGEGFRSGSSAANSFTGHNKAI